MDQRLILEFCRARQKYQERQRQTSEERSETNETYKSVLALLTESMRRNGQRCIRCVHDGQTLYLRLNEGRRRAMVLKTADDVLGLLDSVASSVTHVTNEDLPDAVARLFESRARANGTDVPPRIAIVPRVGLRETIVEQSSTSSELQTLTSQMTQSHVERTRLRRDMAPVRKEMRDAERRLCERDKHVNEVVQMRPAPASEGGAAPAVARTLSVSTVESAKQRNVFGIRNVCKCVREAVAQIDVRDESFDRRLHEEVRRILERERASAQVLTRRVVVKRHRA